MFKKSLQILLIIMALTMPWKAMGQTIEIGDGTTTTYSVPINIRYAYTFAEMIYSNDEINAKSHASNLITSIEFYHQNKQQAPQTVVIYMKNVDNELFSTPTYIPITDDDIVFSGDVIAATNDWTTINLDNVFEYTPGKHLLIAINKTAGGENTANINWRYTQKNNSVIYVSSYDDDNTPAHGQRYPFAYNSATYGYPYQPVTQIPAGDILPGQLNNKRPNIRITFYQPAAPTNLTAHLTDGEGTIATLSWTDNTNSTGWKLQYGTDNEFGAGNYQEVTSGFNTSHAPTISCDIAGLEPETEHYARVMVYNNASEQSEWSKIMAFTPTNMSSITVNDASDAQRFVPFHYQVSSYNTLASQFILPFSDDFIPMIGGEIEKLTFYSDKDDVTFGTAQFKVYMSEVNISKLTEYIDWTTLSDVYTGTVSVSYGKMQIEFETPYTYNGGNLLVGFKKNNTEGTNPTQVVQWIGDNNKPKGTSMYTNSNETLPDAGTQTKFVPKVTINYTPASCVKPINLAVTNEGKDVTLTWASNATEWHVAHSNSATYEPDINTSIEVFESTYTFNSVELGDHYYWVCSHCSGTSHSDWEGPVYINIDYCIPHPSSVNGNGISNVSFGTGDNIVNNDTPKAFYTDCTDKVGDIEAGVISNIAITFETGTTYGTIIWVDLNDNLAFEKSEILYTGMSTAENPTTLNAEIFIPNTQERKNYYMRIGTANSAFDSYINGTTTTDPNPCYQGSYACFQDYTINLIDGPSCLCPTNLSATEDLPTSSMLSWTKNSGETSWTIYYKKVSDEEYTPIDVTDNSDNPHYLLEPLTPATHYEYYIVAHCSGTEISDPSFIYHFTTGCNAYENTPFIETFEDFTVNEVPICWDNSESTSSTLASHPEYIWGICAYGNRHLIRMDNYYAQSGTALINSPAINIPTGDEYQLSFDYSHRADCGAFKVKISTDGGTTFTDLESYTQTGTISHTGYDKLIDATISLADYAGQQVIIQFFANANYGNGAIFITDVQVKVKPDCEKPTNLNVTGVTTSQANLHWTANNEEDGWLVYYKKMSDEAYNTPVEVSGSPNNPHCLLEGLSAATSYECYVVAQCSDISNSEPSEVFTFDTECDAITAFPWSETFESYEAGDFHEICWQNIHLNGSGTQVFQVYTEEMGTNLTNKLVLPDQASGTTTKLRLPSMNLPDNNYQFSIDVYRNNLFSSYTTEGIRVYASTNGEISGATQLAFIPRYYNTTGANIPAESEPGWYTYELPIGISGHCYIILRGESKWGADTYIDNFIVEPIPSCGKPKALTCDSHTAHTATLSWTNGANDQELWQIAYSKNPNFDPDDQTPDVVTRVDVTTNPATLENLKALQYYYVYVRANCGTVAEPSYSPWCFSKVTFRTFPATMTPTNLTVDEESIRNDRASVYWHGIASNDLHQSFELYYSTESVMPEVLVPESLIQGITDTIYELTPLDPSQPYYVWVRDNCGDDGMSAWSAEPVSFTTLDACPVPTNVTSSDETAHGITLAWTGYSESYTVSIGELIKTTFKSYDFENNAISSDFINSTTLPWTVTNASVHSGNYAIKSGGADNANSDLTLTVTLPKAGRLEFYGKVSSESGYDFSIFYIDNEPICQESGTNNDWTRHNYELTAGTHTFMWRYHKDSSVAAGDDCFYVDDITIITCETTSWMDYAATTSPYTLFDATNIDPETEYSVKITGICDGVGQSNPSEIINFTTIASCLPPTGLAISNLTHNSATFTWTAEDVLAYQYCILTNPTPNYTPADTEYNNTTTNNTVSFTNVLVSDTRYGFYLRKMCTDIDKSNPVSIEFTTDYEVPYLEQFTSDQMPDRWNKYNQLLTDDVLNGTTPLTETGGSWVFDGTNGFSTYHPKVNIWSIIQSWLVTPKIALADDNLLSFDMALTQYGNNDPIVDPTEQDDDRFVVLASIDNGATWTVLREWNNTGSQYNLNSIPNTGTRAYITLPSSFDGKEVRIAFYAESTVSGGDKDLHIDNVSIDETPSCYPVSSLNYTELGSTSVTMNWFLADTEQESWQICINNDMSNLINVSTEDDGCVVNGSMVTYNLTQGLSPENDYAIKVRANCGYDGYGEWSKTISFTTHSNCPTPTALSKSNITAVSANVNWSGSMDVDLYNVRYRAASSIEGFKEEFNDDNIPAGWKLYNGGYINDVLAGNDDLHEGWTNWHTSSYALGSYNVCSDIYGTSLSSWLVTPEISLGNNPALGFDVALTDYYSANPNYGNNETARFVVVINHDNTWTILREWNNTTSAYILNDIPATGEYINNISLSAYANKTIKIGFYVESTGYDYNYPDIHIDNVCVGTPVAAPTVWSTTSSTTTSAQITNLEGDTRYEVQVKSSCSEDDWSDPTYFLTLHDGTKVFTTAGDWSTASNWMPNGAPAITDNVIIRANATIGSGTLATANKITFEGSQTPTLTIADGGQLHTNNNVDAIVKKEITAYQYDGSNPEHPADGYYLVAIPVYDYYGYPSYYGMITESTYDLYAWEYDDADGNEWQNYKNGSFYYMDSYIGYLYANEANVTLSFNGSVLANNEDKIIDLGYTPDESSYDFNGWNLIGNPFSCNAYSNKAFYRMNAAGTELEAATGAIAPSEGLFVQATAQNQSVTFSRTAPATAPGKGNLNIALEQKVNTRGMTGATDKAIVRFGEGDLLEKFSFREGSTKIYIPQDGTEYAVVNSEGEGSMPVNLKVAETGTYTISFNNDDVDFSYLHLIDNFSGEDIDLLIDDSYTFSASVRDRENRFTLVFTTSDGSNDINSDTFIYQNDDQLIVTGEGTLQVYDVMGRFVASYEVNGTKSISASQFANAVYIFRMVGNDVKTQKIVVK